MYRNIGWFLAAAILSVVQVQMARATQPLGLDGFLKQVRESSPGYQGALESGEGGVLASRETSLATLPALFGVAQLSSDAKPSQIPLLSYDRLKTNVYTLGLSELTTFGLQAKLSYSVNYIEFVNPVLPAAAAGTFSVAPYYEGVPKLEVSQSLWSNGFGRSTRAQLDASEAGTLAQAFGSRFQARLALSRAENTYWRLVFAREVVEVQKGALGRAEKIHDKVSRQAGQQLADQADALQAKAALELKRLDLQSAIDEERSARLAFNSARNLISDEVTEQLEPIDIARVQSLSAPERSATRDDVRAATEQARLAEAQAEIGHERVLPSVDVYGSYALYGRNDGLGSTLPEPFSDHRETAAVGVRFSVPLSIGAAGDARQGYVRERAGAELTLGQKLLEQESEWSDLSRKFTESKTRLMLSQQVETTQAAKLAREKTRLSTGRSTTYQVLLFEQDFAQAQLLKIRAESEVLGLIAQMKTFGAPLGLGDSK